MTDKEPSPSIGSATLADVAREAGVNKSTVSSVLSNGRGNTRVSDSTREHIHSVANALNYQPNALARSLRSRRSHAIGFYMSCSLDTRNLFLSEAISGLYEGCERNRRDFLMHGTFRGDSTHEIYAELLNGKVDGLVLHVTDNDSLVSQLAASRLPVVAIANPVPMLASVTVDDVGGSLMLASHLRERGHKRILYIGSPFPLSSAARREVAFLAAAADHGMDVETIRAGNPSSVANELNQARPGEKRAQSATAIVCWNDQIAYWAIGHVRSKGIQVPDDVGVAGFDGITKVIPSAFQLTTIRAPWHEVACTAVDMLCSSSGKPSIDETMLPVELATGETT